MRDPSRVTSFSGRSTGSRNRKANRNDHLFRIRPLPSSSFIAQTASRASSLQSRDDQVRSFVDSWRGIATRVNRRAKNVYRKGVRIFGTNRKGFSEEEEWRKKLSVKSRSKLAFKKWWVVLEAVTVLWYGKHGGSGSPRYAKGPGGLFPRFRKHGGRYADSLHPLPTLSPVSGGSVHH